MAAENAERDQNNVPTLLAVSSVDGVTPTKVYADPTTHRLLVDIAAASIGETIAGGTTGSVLFIGPSSTLAQDNSNFFWDDTNNRLGIGMNAPTVKLEITPATSGNTIRINRVGTGATNGSSWGIGIRNSADTDSVSWGQSASTYTTGGALGWVGNSEAFMYYASVMRFGTGVGATPVLSMLANGNVGVGVVTPLDKLHIGAGDLRIANSNSSTDVITNNINFVNTNVTNSPLAAVSIKTGAATANSNIIFQTSDIGTMTEKVRITGAGNLGIGTVSPSTPLHVIGTIRTSGDLELSGTGTISVGQRVTDVENQNTYYRSNVGLSADTNGGAYILLQSTTSAGGSVSDGIVNINAYGQGSNADANSIKFLNRVGANNSSERARIDTSGNFLLNTTAAGTSAVAVFAIKTGTAPSTVPADVVQIYSSDSAGAGTGAVSVYQEAAPYAGVAVASTTKIPVVVNGVTYYLLATTVA